jgi:hypothetical protein
MREMTWQDARAAMPVLDDDERLETIEYAKRIATDRTGVIIRNRALAQVCCELGAAFEQLQADPARPAVSPTVVPAITSAIDYLEALSARPSSMRSAPRAPR